MLPSIRRCRVLLPRFLLGRCVLAWQCSACGKMFTLGVEEAERLCYGGIPDHIQSAFDGHDCELQLEVVAERIQQSPRRQ